MAYIHRSECQYATMCQGVTQLPKVYVTVRLLTVDPFVNHQRIIKRSARLKTSRGCTESESRSMSRPAQLESGSISWRGQKVGLHVHCSAGHRWLSTEGSTLTDQSPHMYNL